jgi:hypothetical protein
MTTFAERHPKSPSDGRFTRRVGTPPEDGVQLIATDAHEIFKEWSGGWLPTVTPGGPAELCEAFDEATAQDRQHQIVRIAHPMAWTTTPIEGGRWGAPTLIQIATNTGPLIFNSGYAVIFVDAPGQCEIDAENHAVVEVIVAAGRSALVTARGRASVRVAAGDGARGGLHVRDVTATGELSGDTAKFYFTDVRDQEIKG